MPTPVTITTSTPQGGSPTEVSLLGAVTNKYIPASTADTNAALLKATPGTVFGLEAKNNAAYDVFVMFYDTALQAVPGTDTVRKRVIVPAGKTVYWSAPAGVYFKNGISMAIVKLAALNDATAIAAGDITSLSIDFA